MFSLPYFAEFWISTGALFCMSLLIVFVVRFVMPREQLRDQWFMGCLGALATLVPSVVSNAVGQLTDAGPFPGLGDTSLSSFLFWQFIWVTAIGLAAAALLFLMIPRDRRKVLFPALGIGMLLGLSPVIVPLAWQSLT